MRVARPELRNHPSPGRLYRRRHRRRDLLGRGHSSRRTGPVAFWSGTSDRSVPMLSAEDNELLTRTGPGTTMGDLFRRFWMPVLLSRELPEPDCPPMRVKVLGEDLLAFRDTENRVGLVEPTCPHRGANLFFGRNEECGIRCAYHGWKFDVRGECVELPTMERDEGLRSRVRLTAYPAQDWGD